MAEIILMSQTMIHKLESHGPVLLGPENVEIAFDHAVMSPDHADCPLALSVYKPYFIYSYSIYISPFSNMDS